MNKHVFCMIMASTLAACGGKPEPKAVETAPTAGSPPPVATAARKGPKLGVQQELGEIDPKLAKAALEKADPALFSCHKAGIKRVEYLSGAVKAFLRVGEDGKVRWAYLEDSSMGDRATERCMLDVLSRTPFPKPEGGDAEIHKGWTFDGGDAREPSPWPADKLAAALDKQKAEIAACRAGTKGSFKVTAYVEPDGARGKVATVGIAPPDKDGESKVDCLVRALTGMEAPSPGSYAAKVSFSL